MLTGLFKVRLYNHFKDVSMKKLISRLIVHTRLLKKAYQVYKEVDDIGRTCVLHCFEQAMSIYSCTTYINQAYISFSLLIGIR